MIESHFSNFSFPSPFLCALHTLLNDLIDCFNLFHSYAAKTEKRDFVYSVKTSEPPEILHPVCVDGVNYHHSTELPLNKF